MIQFIETKSRMVAARGEWGGENGEMLVNEYNVLLIQNEEVLEMYYTGVYS
jgi:hypothetical protein